MKNLKDSEKKKLSLNEFNFFMSSAVRAADQIIRDRNNRSTAPKLGLAKRMQLFLEENSAVLSNETVQTNQEKSDEDLSTLLDLNDPKELVL